jgi:CBS domain-containing protein
MVWPDTPVAEVLGEMVARHIGSALVVDHASLARGRVAGIFTACDAMRTLAQMTGEGS